MASVWRQGNCTETGFHGIALRGKKKEKEKEKKKKKHASQSESRVFFSVFFLSSATRHYSSVSMVTKGVEFRISKLASLLLFFFLFFLAKD